MTPNITQTISRRRFLNSTAMTAAGALMLKPRGARASASGSLVRLGLLGCGGRGTTVATGFVNNTQTRVVAIADLFPDKLDTARKHLDEIQAKLGYPAIDLSQIFRGPHACEQIAASKEVDFILITTPPYFHPSHLETVVAAGKHVYCEKPVAIDVPGAKKVIRIGEKAQGKLSLEVGFQLRKAPPYVELVKRIHAGALGEIGCGMGSYCCGHLDRPDWPGASPEEARLRNWLWDRALSGDISVEQNIHIIDIFNWTLQRHPGKAVGSGSRKLRTDSGNCWDNFNIVFTYPDDVQVSFNSTQFGNPAFDAGAIFDGPKGSFKPITITALASPEQSRGTRGLVLHPGRNNSQPREPSRALLTRPIRKSKRHLSPASPAVNFTTRQPRAPNPRSAPCWGEWPPTPAGWSPGMN